MLKIKAIIGCLALGLMLFGTSCKSDYPTYQGPDYIMFSAESHDLGVLDSQEWFEIPVSATRTADHDRTIGVEILPTRTNAIEGVHFMLESSTLRIPAGQLTTAVRIKCNPENIEVSDSLGVALRLVIDKENVWDIYGTDTDVLLHKCCPVDLNQFTGYCKVTSTWLMQYMNTDSRLIVTERDPENEDVIILRDLFYEGYDVRVTFNSENRLNPVIEMEDHVIGTTGEAFGTIYGNGKLMMTQATGYPCYFSSCENFMMQYTTMFVEEVGTVGTYVHIMEWISDAEADRIMQEGF